MDDTFALYESGAGYELVNDHIVTAGEHTIPAATVAKTVGHGGKDLFDIDELNRPALERAITARAAIEIMGEHVEKYGYNGTEWDKRSNYAESGEALSIPDLVEAWMFHIVPDDTGASAVWVGKRVPDGHISAVAIRPLSATSNSTMPAISCIRLTCVLLQNGSRSEPPCTSQIRSILLQCSSISGPAVLVCDPAPVVSIHDCRPHPRRCAELGN